MQAELEARIARVECECASLRETLAAATLAIETLAHAHDRERAVASVNAELVARNVALTGAAPSPPPACGAFVSTLAASATLPPGTIVVRDDALGVALLGNSATYAMRLELKRYGSWVTDAPARWVVPREDYEQNRAEWSTRFGVTFARE